MENKHYIETDERGRILTGWSDGPCPGKDVSGAVCLSEEGGYQFRLSPRGAENPRLLDGDGIPLYKWTNGTVIPRTQQELEADRGALPEPEEVPGQAERIAELEEALELLLSGGVE